MKTWVSPSSTDGSLCGSPQQSVWGAVSRDRSQRQRREQQPLEQGGGQSVRNVEGAGAEPHEKRRAGGPAGFTGGRDVPQVCPS